MLMSSLNVICPHHIIIECRSAKSASIFGSCYVDIFYQHLMSTSCVAEQSDLRSKCGAGAALNGVVVLWCFVAGGSGGGVLKVASWWWWWWRFEGCVLVVGVGVVVLTVFNP